MIYKLLTISRAYAQCGFDDGDDSKKVHDTTIEAITLREWYYITKESNSVFSERVEKSEVKKVIIIRFVLYFKSLKFSSHVRIIL